MFSIVLKDGTEYGPKYDTIHDAIFGLISGSKYMVPDLVPYVKQNVLLAPYIWYCAWCNH